MADLAFSQVEGLTRLINSRDDWTENELAIFTSLMQKARQLDDEYHAATSNGYELGLRNLLKARAKADLGKKSKLEELLEDLDDEGEE